MSSLSPEDMAEEKPVIILQQYSFDWKSKQYDNTEEEIWLSNVVTLNKMAVVQPSLDQFRVRNAALI